MQDAIRTARREIDTFLDRLQHPQPNQTDFAIKAAFAEGEQIEHMWLIDLKYDSGLLIGTLANQPELTKTFEYGTSYAVTPEEISDWYYFENDRMIGGYTLQ